MYVCNLTITSPMAVPSVVTTVTMILADDGLLRYNNNIDDP